MAVAFVPFGAYSPGGSSFGDQLSDVKNAIPLYGSYFPLRQKVVDTSVSAGPMQGGYAHVFPSGIGTTSYLADAVTVFAGTAAALYDTGTNPWTDLSRVGGYGAASSPAAWRFVSFGNDVWATNGIDPTQRRTNNAGIFADGITSTFKPAGRFLGVVREFMIEVSLSNVGRFADEFAWSDANDATWFDDRTGTRPASLAGQKRIVSRPGQITGFVGGEFGVFFKRRSIHALQYTGGNDVWRLDEISHGVGLGLPGSLIAGEDGNYFFSGRGFYMQSGLEPPVKISPPEIDQLFTDSVHFLENGFYHQTMTRIVDEYSLMIGEEDAATGLKLWFYRTFGTSTAGTPLVAGVAYDPQSHLWSRIDGINLANQMELVGLVARPDSYTGATTGDTIRLFGFDYVNGSTSSRFTFSGNHEEATFSTQRQVISFPDMSPTGRFRLNGIMPIFTVPANSAGDPAPVPNVQISVRTANDPQFVAVVDDLGGTISPRSEAYVETDANDWGWFPHSIEGRVWDITLIFPIDSEWRNCTGVWINGEPVG